MCVLVLNEAVIFIFSNVRVVFFFFVVVVVSVFVIKAVHNPLLKSRNPHLNKGRVVFTDQETTKVTIVNPCLSFPSLGGRLLTSQGR